MEQVTCFHCTHVFDFSNLQKECRRDVTKTQGEVDIITILASCYKLSTNECENKLRLLVDNRDECFVCKKCFNTIKAISTSIRKCQSLTETLQSTASTNFSTLLSTLNTETAQSDTVHDPADRKRSRDCLTPMKTGCTPKGKKIISSTPKANRRRLNFSHTPRNAPKTPKTPKSPGPKVKVHIYKICNVNDEFYIMWFRVIFYVSIFKLI